MSARFPTGTAASIADISPVTFRVCDLAAIAAPLLFGVLLLAPPFRGETLDGARLLAVALGALLMRIGPARSSRPVLQTVARLYPLLAVGCVYMWLNPVIDRVSPHLFDGRLTQLDQALFGTIPAVALQSIHHPALTELLFICYAAFFAWQAGLLTLLWRRGDKRDFEHFFTTLVLFYFLSDVMYLLVPAIGPRFALAGQFHVPLEGLWFAEGLEQSFRDNPMLRDCFPSGHTGLTLLVLGHAWHKHARRFFWVMLPFAALLIFSTLYCRFHYAVDLLCALPFLLAVITVQSGLERALPGGVLTLGQASSTADQTITT